MARSRRSGLVSSRTQVAALTSAVRQEIVDTLEGLGGEAAVADVARHLGRPADGIYYHLRQLVRAGILEEIDGGPRGRGSDRGHGIDHSRGRRYRTTSPPGGRISLRYRRGNDGNTAAVSDVVAGLLRTARRDFERALRSGDAAVSGDLRELWGGRTKGWVNDADLAEINRLLKRLANLLHKPRNAARGRLMSLAFVLAPIPARPVRRPVTR